MSKKHHFKGITRNVLVLLLAAVFLVPGAGCSKKENNEPEWTESEWFEVVDGSDSAATDSSETDNPSGQTSEKTDSSKTSSGDGGNVTASVTDEMKEKANVKMLVWWTPTASEEQKKKEFTQKTGVNVDFVQVPMLQYDSQLATLVASGKRRPTIARMSNETFPMPITRNLLQPIDIGKFDLNDPAYDISMMDSFKWNGKYYGVAIKGSTFGHYFLTFWNKSMFKEKSLTETPEKLYKEGKWNWKTFLSVAQSINDASNGVYGVGTWFNTAWISSTGADFIKQTSSGMASNVSDQRIYDAVKYVYELRNVYKVADPAAIVYPQSFIQRKCAMYIGGSFLMQKQSEIAVNMKDEWGVVPMPCPEGQKYVASCEGLVWGIPRGVSSLDAEASALFLRYFLDPANDSSSAPVYYNDECKNLMTWLSSQTKSSANSYGVLAFGGNYNREDLMNSIFTNVKQEGDIKSAIESWKSPFEKNIKEVMDEMK